MSVNQKYFLRLVLVLKNSLFEPLVAEVSSFFNYNSRKQTLYAHFLLCNPELNKLVCQLVPVYFFLFIIHFYFF